MRPSLFGWVAVWIVAAGPWIDTPVLAEQAGRVGTAPSASDDAHPRRAGGASQPRRRAESPRAVARLQTRGGEGQRAEEAAGEVPEIETDRPDFTESAIVVPHRSVQIESGFTYERDSPGRLLGGPESLIRWGFSKRTELRVGVPNYLDITGPDAASGLSDSFLGFKHQLGPISGFDASLIGHVFIPSGSPNLTSGAPDPTITLAWARDLTEKWSLGGIFLFGWPTEQDDPTLRPDRNFTTLATLVLGSELGGPWATFIEYIGELPDRGPNSHFAHHGYTYALSRRAQLDVHGAVGLTANSPDFFLGGGYSIRLGR